MSKPSAAQTAAVVTELPRLGEDDENEITAVRPRYSEPPRLADLDSGASELPPLPDPAVDEPRKIAGDSMLARYFRDMANHPVMGHDEEIEAAKQVEAAEVEHWMNLLSYQPAAPYILEGLREDVNAAGPEKIEAPEVDELIKLVRGKPLSGRRLDRYNDLSRQLALRVQLPDSDRLWVARAWRIGHDVGCEPDPTNWREHVSG
ncbi:MAG TPA: hypothetical protein VFB75_05590, partial [Burkholderiales bacterium]|nr:hypothetical protein [Burkholderiales bacterium]